MTPMGIASATVYCELLLEFLKQPLEKLILQEDMEEMNFWLFYLKLL